MTRRRRAPDRGATRTPDLAGGVATPHRSGCSGADLVTIVTQLTGGTTVRLVRCVTCGGGAMETVAAEPDPAA